jgi:DNA-binding transcriptional LysR family regulator
MTGEGMGAALDSDLLRTFVAVADTRNFTRAGEIVGRSQSAVSLQIKRLEDVVGAVLFDRGPRGVVLTTQADMLLANARRIIALLDETAAAMPIRPLNGPVRIGVPEEYSHTLLPKALGTFAKLHPLVEVTVKYGQSAAHRLAFEAGELDLAVVFEPSGSVSAEPLMIDPTVWVTSSVHCVHEHCPLPVALNDTQGWCRAAALASLQRLAVPFRIAYTADTSGALQAAATCGLAIAPLSRSHIPAQCRELTADDGFDIIDASSVGLLQKPGARAPAIAGMADAVRDAFTLRLGAF